MPINLNVKLVEKISDFKKVTYIIATIVGGLWGLLSILFIAVASPHSYNPFSIIIRSSIYFKLIAFPAWFTLLVAYPHEYFQQLFIAIFVGATIGFLLIFSFLEIVSFFKDKNNFGLFRILIIIIVLFTLGGGAYYLIKLKTQELYMDYTTVLEMELQSMKETDSAQSISGWKTYRNEKYGFEMKYPPDWYIQFENPSVFFANVPKEKNLETGIPPNPGYWIAVKKEACKDVVEEFTKYEIEPKYYILLKTVCKPNFTIALGLWESDADKESHKLILDQILSTFKFIEIIKLPAIDMASWLEYKNDEYGFKVKYPPDWYWKDLLSNNSHLANEAMIGLAPKSFGGVDFEVLIQVNNRSPEENANEISTSLDENTELVSISDILFKGVSGKKIIFKNKTTKLNSAMIVLSRNADISYIISLPSDDDLRIFSTLDFY